MIAYQNIKNGLDFVRAFEEHNDTVAYLERKTKRLKKERDTYKRSTQELVKKYKILLSHYRAVVPRTEPCEPY